MICFLISLLFTGCSRIGKCSDCDQFERLNKITDTDGRKIWVCDDCQRIRSFLHICSEEESEKKEKKDKKGKNPEKEAAVGDELFGEGTSEGKVSSGQLPCSEVLSDGGIYKIKTKLDEDYVLSIEDDDNLKLCQNVARAGQVFRIESDGEGYYYIINVNNEMALSADDYLTKEEGTGDCYRIYQEKKSFDDRQKWEFEHVGDGYYTIRNKSNGMYLDVQDAYAVYGNNVNTFDRNTLYNAQEWKLQWQR